MQEKLSEVVLILVGSTGIILILITLVVISLFISERRKNRHRKELMEMKISFEREVFRTQLETQTQTFETISHELHDNVGSLISMALVHIKSEKGKPHSEKGNEAELLLDEALTVLRDISRSINPENIQKMGLSQAVRNEVDRLNRLRVLKADFRQQGEDFSVEPQKQIIIFRIVQEALNNVVKHSRASRVSVSVQFDQPELSILIQDNGSGFVYQPGQGDFRNHSGLVNMAKRARMIQANLMIQSEPDKGTTVHLSYPDNETGQAEKKYQKLGMAHSRAKVELAKPSA